MTDDLAAFIAARLGEDEATAQACIDSGGNLSWFDSLVRATGDHTIRTSPGNRPVARIRLADSAASDGRTLNPDACASHIARHDPARALREAAALRAIVKWHPSEPMRNIDASRCPQCELTWPCPAIRAIAAIWSDHPGYRAGWKP